MNSRTADSKYLTPRPTFTKGGPVPVNLDLASQESDTHSRFATSLGGRRGSIVPNFGLLGFSMVSPSLMTMAELSQKQTCGDKGDLAGYGKRTKSPFLGVAATVFEGSYDRLVKSA
jgi:hypothetical protein